MDTALDNYVALHYNSMQMNFLHCFYGIGVTASPFLMSMALADHMNWQKGYRTAFMIQLVIAALSLLSLPLWGKLKRDQVDEEFIHVLPLGQMLRRKKIFSFLWGIRLHRRRGTSPALFGEAPF